MTVTLPDTDRIADDMADAIRAWNSHTERGQQSVARRAGISDIGVCREMLRRFTVEEEYTDQPEEWKAFIGTATDDFVKQAVKLTYPGVITDMNVLLTLPSGASYPGHPDLVLDNGVIDVKTTGSPTTVRRIGANFAQQCQRHGYGAALVQAGVFPDERDVWVGNAWFDRTGQDPRPHVQVEPLDMVWLTRMDEWLSDVIYAVQHGEEAPKDKPIEFCAVACPFYSACRGPDLARATEGLLLTDLEVLEAVDQYVEAHERIKALEREKHDAARKLWGINGSTGTHRVRWIDVDASYVEGYTRQPYSKIDIRKLPIERIKP